MLYSVCLDLTEKRFGRWLVTGPAEQKYYWLCLCLCGRIRPVRGSTLLSGASASCGCGIALAITKHGQTGIREYRIWVGLRNRCYNVKNPKFSLYGGRGIEVCPRWRDSFPAFLEDMGFCPPGLSIDRINNDADYCPENCRWATKVEQARNKSNNRMVQIGDRIHCIAEWAELLGIEGKLIHNRLSANWSVEEALGLKRIGC